MTKSIWGGKGVFHFTCNSLAREGKGKKELNAGTRRLEPEAVAGMRVAGLLTLLSYTTRDHYPRTVPPTLAWVLPLQSLIKTIIRQTCPQTHLTEGFSP